MLILLVPNWRAKFCLWLCNRRPPDDPLMARGEDDPTAGFTYWDFEDLFKADREEVLKGGQ